MRLCSGIHSTARFLYNKHCIHWEIRENIQLFAKTNWCSRQRWHHLPYLTFIVQIPLVASRHDMSRHDTHGVSRLLCVSRHACSDMAVVLACTNLVFCALDLHQSQEKKFGEHVHPQVHAVAMPLNTWRACCPTSATQHDFFLCQNDGHGLDTVSCSSDMTQQVEFGLIAATYAARDNFHYKVNK